MRAHAIVLKSKDFDALPERVRLAVKHHADVIAIDGRVVKCRFPGVDCGDKWKRAQRALKDYGLTINDPALLKGRG